MGVQSVTSSTIDKIGYRPASDELLVCFRNGRAYVYSGVPHNVFNDLMEASSHGGYFNGWIRDKYPTTEVQSGALEAVIDSFRDTGGGKAYFVDLTWRPRQGVNPLALFA